MKLKSIFVAMVVLLSGMIASANNIQVSNISLTGMDATNDYTMVKFNLSWENSWRTSSTPSNWDAAWVFVKYRVNGGDWQHARLNNTGHVAASGSTLTTGLLTPNTAFNATTNPGMGVYVYRSTDGTGDVAFNDIELRWNYGANGVGDNDVIDVQVFAVEMVYVPAGSFYLGSGGSYETGSFTTGNTSLPLQGGGASSLIGASSSSKTITVSGTGSSLTGLQVGQVLVVTAGTGRLSGISNYDTVASILNATQFTVKNTPAVVLNNATLQVWGNTNPFQITSEGSITIDNAAGSIWGTSCNNSTTIGSTPSAAARTLAAAFPKGYAAFYCMKYEISQSQYVDYLNTLTRTQQANRIGTSISGTSITNRYVMSNSSSLLGRNGIRCDATIPSSPTRVTFYCDLNGNGIPNESADGLNIACNYITNTDFFSFLDWSGLRLMTEFEYEKACRGTVSPTINEYSWGTASGTNATAISGSGTSTEVVSTANANVHCNNVLTSGPIRVGNFARSSSTRTQAGATFYGILDMSGNLWERSVSISDATGRAYTGNHGDGSLAADGTANVTNWLSNVNPTLSLRGGAFNTTTIPTSMISDRTNGSFVGNTRIISYGGRGVRTAE